MTHLFVSDVHLGGQLNEAENLKVEKRFLEWLDKAHSMGAVIYLLGDIFDFWFEYKRVVPTTYLRVMGKLRELVDKGTEIHFFKGNHDMWLMNYLSDEVGLIVHSRTEVVTINGEKLMIGHGHDLDFKSRFSTTILWVLFSSKLIYRLTRAFIPPSLLIAIAHKWSAHSKRERSYKPVFKGEDSFIVKYIRKHRDKHIKEGISRYIFGHFHTPAKYQIDNDGTELIVLGRWDGDTTNDYQI